MRYNFDRLWNHLKRHTWLARFVQRECDIPLACDLSLVRVARSMKEALATGLLRNPIPLPKLLGADGGYGTESRRWLQPDVATMDFSGTGSEGQFDIMDWFLVDVIGFTFGVAGTTTACKIDFDRYPATQAQGSIIASNLDGTNGTVTAPNNTTAMAIGAVVYKSLETTGPVLCNPGNSIDVDVATACTAGSNAMAFVLGHPKPETHLNLTAGFLGT